jgi:predicted RNA-binding protein YlxR (DUF448 family)
MAAARLTAPEFPKDRATVTPQRPIRTCIGCRERAAVAELLRVVAGPGALVVPDLRRRIPGRGAWLHPDQRCVELAERRRAFARALRVPGPIDPTPVCEYLAERTQTQTTRGTPQEMRNHMGTR